MDFVLLKTLILKISYDHLILGITKKLLLFIFKFKATHMDEVTIFRFRCHSFPRSEYSHNYIFCINIPFSKGSFFKDIYTSPLCVTPPCIISFTDGMPSLFPVVLRPV